MKLKYKNIHVNYFLLKKVDCNKQVESNKLTREFNFPSVARIGAHQENNDHSHATHDIELHKLKYKNIQLH